MNEIANPEMLTLAREIRGLTQTELALKSEIDQGRISRYEGGLKSIPESDLATLSRVLSFPVRFFYRDGKRRGTETGELFHRQRKVLSATEQKRVDRLLDLYRLGIDKLLDGIDQISPYSIPTYKVEEFDGDIDAIAAAVRAGWDMPSGPVNNVIAQLEAASCMIFSYDFGTDKIDEVAQWVEPLPPIIMANNRAPGDRLRFSLAHALGHLVMHHNSMPYPKMEEEADQFASAFLMPAEDIRPELPPVTIDHMLQLKPYWKVSMQALIYRAQEIGEISERQYTSLFQMLSRVGYRKKEPFPIALEIPEQVRDLLDYYKHTLNYSNSSLAEFLMLYEEDFVEWYYTDPLGFTFVKPPRRTG